MKLFLAAFRADYFTSEGVPLALLHEVHLSIAVKCLALDYLAVSGLRRSRIGIVDQHLDWFLRFSDLGFKLLQVFLRMAASG
jgi:hypothetical protein